MMFVASKRPPMPTSRMTMSTAASSKIRSEVNVRSSKDSEEKASPMSVFDFARQAVVLCGKGDEVVDAIVDVDEMGRVEYAAFTRMRVRMVDSSSRMMDCHQYVMSILGD